MADKAPIYYAVVCIASDELLYIGTSHSRAARFLEPGTCYASSRQARHATQAARVDAKRFRKSMRLPSPHWVDKHCEHPKRSSDPSQEAIAARSKVIREEGFEIDRYSGRCEPWTGQRYLS